MYTGTSHGKSTCITYIQEANWNWNYGNSHIHIHVHVTYDFPFVEVREEHQSTGVDKL